ncbi:MAG: 4Fe-4S dicluster domain-containing protein [Methanobrevibacter sp.]|jgi:NAD-dependent dihydropyrimidine dehydrogenase PreA subunit|nr:4Fe-4S dicluster domain-containing protein [Candidatus Methanovirga basalitermitum]
MSESKSLLKINSTNLKSHPIIHKNECKGCGRCITGCSENVIELYHELNKLGYNYAKYKGEGCIGCGDCYYTCPEPLAIEVYTIKKR